MHFYIFVAPTEFTEICQEPSYEFCSIVVVLRRLFIQGRPDVPLEGYTTPRRHQRLFTPIWLRDDDLESFVLFITFL